MNGHEAQDGRAREERVRAVLDGVFGLTASPTELLAAAHRGIEEIDRVASTAATPAEQVRLLDLCEPLEQIAEELEESVGEPS